MPRILKASDPDFKARLVASTIKAQLANGLPTTAAIRNAYRLNPQATKADFLEAAKECELNPSTVTIQYSAAVKLGASSPLETALCRVAKTEAKVKAEPKPVRAKKVAKDLPAVGSRVKFLYLNRNHDLHGQVLEGVVTKLRGREIVIQPDKCSRPTWIFKAHLRPA